MNWKSMSVPQALNILITAAASFAVVTGFAFVATGWAAFLILAALNFTVCAFCMGYLMGRDVGKNLPRRGSGP